VEKRQQKKKINISATTSSRSCIRSTSELFSFFDADLLTNALMISADICASRRRISAFHQSATPQARSACRRCDVELSNKVQKKSSLHYCAAKPFPEIGIFSFDRRPVISHLKVRSTTAGESGWIG